MVEDQSFRKVKRFIFSLSLFLLLTNLSFAKNFNLEKIVDLNGPWGSSFINNEELIITEKSGKIKVVNIISKQISEIKHNLNFLEHGQGGILDILFKDNFIYVSYTENRGNGKTSTSIAKTKFAEKELKFENIFLIIFLLSTSMLPVDEPKKSFSAGINLLSVFNISS